MPVVARVLAGFALSVLASASHASPSSPSASPLPIGTITVTRHQVFEETTGGLSVIYRLGNTLHLKTRERVVTRELLFREGDPIDLELVEQTTRNLRALPFVRDARIAWTPVDTDHDGRADQVDLHVEVWDTWSLTPQLRIERVGERTLWEVGASETNLLGWGKQLFVSHQVTLDRSANRFLYRDPQLIGSRLTFDLAGATLSDGDEGLVEIGRPFYSLDDEWAFAVRAAAFTRSAPLFSGGVEVRRLRHVARAADVELARGFRRRGSSALRMHVAYRSRYDQVGASLRDFGIIELGIRSTTHDFIQLTHVNQFERTEDLNLGRQSYASLGLSAKALGGQAGRVMFLGAGHTEAARFGPAHFVMGSVGVVGRHQRGAWVNVRAETRVRYLRKHARRHLLIGRAHFQVGHRLDPEVQLLLGTESGLRGYPIRRFAGTRSLLLSAEERWFLVDDVGQLLSLGVAAFIDSGFVWPDAVAVDLRDLKTGVGGSLLLGSSRLSSVPGIRVDLGYGLDQAASGGGWVVNVISGIAF